MLSQGPQGVTKRKPLKKMSGQKPQGNMPPTILFCGIFVILKSKKRKRIETEFQNKCVKLTLVNILNIVFLEVIAQVTRSRHENNDQTIKQSLNCSFFMN